jgi:hypothetical protein
LILVLVCSGCGTEAAGGSGSGGVAGTGGGGGVTTGGIGGDGGDGGTGVQMCMNAHVCNDDDPCTIDRCTDRICSYENLADNTVCLSDTGISGCLSGECQLIWSSCSDEGAEEGDFCESAEDASRLGRCVSGSCEILPCELAFDCWDGDRCTSDVCDGTSGDCSHPVAPDGTSCGTVTPMQCVEGVCVIPLPEP